LALSSLTPYAPFARGSINLLTCSSNTGKTHFLTQIVLHRHRFFQDPERISQLVYVNANERDFSIQHPWQQDLINLTIVSQTLQDLSELSSVVSPHTILVLDDLLQIDSNVDYILKYGAHHFQLFVIIITQSCLSSPLYGLLRSSHSLVLLLGNTSSTRLAQHLIQSYFLCSETKAYLKAILGIAEKQQDGLILKINTIASYRPHSHVLALSRVQGLFHPTLPYCYVYPELGRSDSLMDKVNETMAEMPSLEGQVLPEAFVLMPIGRVKSTPQPTTNNDDGAETDDCQERKKREWDKMALHIENEVERSFLPKRWVSAKNLSRELLLCNDVCIGSDYKTVFVKKKPKQKYSIIDFLNVATRRAGPMEKNNDKVLFYKPLVDILLKHNAPESFFINKMLLQKMGPRRHRRRLSEYDDDDGWSEHHYQEPSKIDKRRRGRRRQSPFYNEF